MSEEKATFDASLIKVLVVGGFYSLSAAGVAGPFKTCPASAEGVRHVRVSLQEYPGRGRSVNVASAFIAKVSRKATDKAPGFEAGTLQLRGSYATFPIGFAAKLAAFEAKALAVDAARKAA